MVDTIVVTLDEITAMDRNRIQVFLMGARNDWFILSNSFFYITSILGYTLSSEI
ncbi:hypothetical protein ACFQ3N_11315 [Virgibacillus byunsanensis]|uniref:MFS transporter n=2 Tax=Virgibacillus byunsanensis TaxID=570945 RepID=A0ABW3LLM2_9BACI